MTPDPCLSRRLYVIERRLTRRRHLDHLLQIMPVFVTMESWTRQRLSQPLTIYAAS